MKNSTGSNAYGQPDRKISVSFTYVNYYGEILKANTCARKWPVPMGHFIHSNIQGVPKNTLSECS